MKKELKLINGYTLSVWKSLAIKSLRIGWVEGLIECSKNISKTELKTALLGSLFEDVFPVSYRDLDDAYNEILENDFENLCSRNTLHGRGYAQEFFDDAERACSKGRLEGDQITKGIRVHTSISWINPRVYNCLSSWYKIKPTQKNAYQRKPLNHKFVGMPMSIIDGHTYEGKRLGYEITLLSGNYENHLKIGKRVMNEGWAGIREEFIKEEIFINPFAPRTLF